MVISQGIQLESLYQMKDQPIEVKDMLLSQQIDRYRRTDTKPNIIYTPAPFNPRVTNTTTTNTQSTGYVADPTYGGMEVTSGLLSQIESHRLALPQMTDGSNNIQAT